jgi:hypothetical protein
VLRDRQTTARKGGLHLSQSKLHASNKATSPSCLCIPDVPGWNMGEKPYWLRFSQLSSDHCDK